MCKSKTRNRLATLGLLAFGLLVIAIAVFIFTHEALVAAAIIVWVLGVGGYAVLTALATKPAPPAWVNVPALEPPRRRPAVGMPARPAIERARPAIEPTRVLPPYVSRAQWERARAR